MNYCKRKMEPTDEVHCLACEHCLPPGDRTDGRLCPDERTWEEFMAWMDEQEQKNVDDLLRFEQQCLEAEQRGDPHRFDGFMPLLGEDIKRGLTVPVSGSLRSKS